MGSRTSILSAAGNRPFFGPPFLALIPPEIREYWTEINEKGKGPGWGQKFRNENVWFDFSVRSGNRVVSAQTYVFLIQIEFVNFLCLFLFFHTRKSVFIRVKSSHQLPLLMKRRKGEGSGVRGRKSGPCSHKTCCLMVKRWLSPLKTFNFFTLLFLDRLARLGT